MLSKQDIACESLVTYLGHIAYVQELLPLLVVFENVDSAADEVSGAENTDVMGHVEKILDDLRNAGYWCFAWVANAKEFALPQSRSRLFILGIRK